MDPLPRTLAGWEILAELGRGTSAVTYRARHSVLTREGALKLLLTSEAEDPVRSARFLRECQVLASLTGKWEPNIPTLWVVTGDQGRLYYVREFVEGSNLDQLAKKGALGLWDGVNALSTIAGTVHRVHCRGVVHRNLNPSNVLIAADGTPKLIGFGSVGVLSKSSAVGVDLPCEPLTADLEALGRMLAWWFAAARQPLPATVNAIWRKCFSTGEVERYRTAAELAEALGSIRTEEF